MSSAEPKLMPKFKKGAKVRVATRKAIGHCRTPWYLRGKTGVVTELHGAFGDPERLAYHKPGLPAQILYKVRFRQKDLWQTYTGAATDQLEADIYEYWLEPVAAKEERE